MAIEDCSCKGINPNCARCFGRGCFDADTKSVMTNIVYKKHENIENETKHNEKDLSGRDSEFFVNKISNSIDDLSYKQAKKPNAVTLKNNTKKISNHFLNKINIIERDKEILCGELEFFIYKGKKIHIEIYPIFKQCFSNKKLNHSSL